MVKSIILESEIWMESQPHQLYSSGPQSYEDLIGHL